MNGTDREQALIDDESITQVSNDAHYRSPRAGRPKNGHLRSLGGPGRKPRACLACRHLKMKCEILQDQSRCKRCHKKDLDCVAFRKPKLPAVSYESNEDLIDAMRREIQNLQKTIHSLVSNHEGPRPEIPGPILDSQVSPSGPSGSSQSLGQSPANLSSCAKATENHGMAMTRENSPEPTQDTNLGATSVLVTEPMGGLYEVTRLRNIRSNQAKLDISGPSGEENMDDFISRGVISEEEAEDLYRIFHMSLNHYLWVGLEQIHISLASVRRSSQLLTATILTITALHIPSSTKTFDDCYNEFLSLISSSMFSRYHSVDDVRALCIAAFWLSDVSWKLSGHAIRIATELNIHQSFFKALEAMFATTTLASPTDDPPMISESLQIREHEIFLDLPLADAIDFRVLSQVSLFQILTRVHDCFAERRLPHQDTTRALLSEMDFPQMRSFNLEIDKWRILWQSRQVANKYIGSFPPKGIVLYSYFAKFQLNSFAVRGINIYEGIISTERKEFANMAVSAAASSLTFVLEEEDLRRALVGTPLYVHTMIAFSAVFLMKVATKWNAVGFNIDPAFVWDLLDRVIHLLKTTITSKRHLLYHIGAGLEKMRTRLLEQENDPQSSMPLHQQSQTPFGCCDENTINQSACIHDRSGAFNSSTWANGSQMAAVDEFPNETDGMKRRTAPETDSGFDQIMSMSNDLIYEVFGENESSYDVYSLLSSQFAG
ncbi:hypothetical protein N7481_008279 [Penicillium waksmanii]|uniref:uncharacterized protein n=1 Tax=Penicillium waksmanii TaxID=69791 RepID=UPI0025488EF3|nr:uncharacterized protein N7481_008279 [Penicillium waksmanii]KAJ5980981.1 hypothetical protein N7481_008279 [Penicillium waksmanii]